MKYLLLLALFTLSLLHADIVENYIQEEIAAEKVINLNENDTEAMEGRLNQEKRKFLVLFLDYSALVTKGKIRDYNPYRSELFKLKRRIKTNRHLENNYAVLRDEVKIASIELKQNIRSTLYKVVQITEDSDYSTFEKQLQKIIVERHTSESTVDLNKYRFVRELETLEPITQSILDNLREYIALQDIHNDLSAVLIEDAQKIYNIALMSGYGILSLAVQIEESGFAKSLTPYLEPLFLSTSKVVYIAIIIAVAFLIRFFIAIVFRKLYRWLTGSDEDAQYIVSKSSRPFTFLLFLIALEFVFMVYSGFIDVEWVFILFNVSYVLLSVFLVYRIGNAIAVVKMEQMNLNKHVRNEVVNLGLKMLNVTMGLIALIIILKLLGVNLTALLSGLGIGGVAVAFAAKDTLANFFGSVSILLSELFEQGDWIAVDDMEGHVVEIGLRATTIRTFDNALVAIPNFRLADNGIKNWSRRTMGRRIKMKIGVTYESDMQNIKKALNDIREMLHDHPDIVTEKTEYSNSDRQFKLVSKEDLKGIKRMIMVYLDEFNSSSIDILVYCFSRSVVWREWHEAKEDVMFKIADILKENDLEFAYPTMMIHQKDTQSEEQKNITE